MYCKECKKNKPYQDFKGGKRFYDICLNCRLFPEIQDIKITIPKDNVVIERLVM